MDELEIKRSELNMLVSNFKLNCDIVVKKAREFEEFANRE